MATMKLPSNNIYSHNIPSRKNTTKHHVSVAAFIKQQPQQQKKESSTKRRRDGFVFAVEEVASRLGLDLTIADLERLYRRTYVPAGHPPEENTEFFDRRRPIRVAYQGGRGSYCQEAAAEAFRAVSVDSFPCTGMEDAFLSLEDFSADRAVVPAENSVDGPIDRNLDLLLRHEDVNIVGELVLPVNHCLMSLPNTRLSDIRRIASHPQALRHCQTRIERFHVDVDEVDSVTDAAKFVSENGIYDTAVIGSKMAAKEYGLQVLEHNFQDPTLNYNRYLQLGLGPGLLGGTRKTTVAFSLANGVSDLFRAMWIFETRRIKVTRVEHRPNKVKPIRVVDKDSGKAMYLDYVFVFDLEGCGSDPKVSRAITVLTEFAGFVRVLGSYACTCENTRS